MNDTMTEAGKLLSELERLSGRTITKSRKDKEKMISLIVHHMSMAKRKAHDMGRKTMKRDVSGVIRPCLDRDLTLQKLMAAIEDLE